MRIPDLTIAGHLAHLKALCLEKDAKEPGIIVGRYFHGMSMKDLRDFLAHMQQLCASLSPEEMGLNEMGLSLRS